MQYVRVDGALELVPGSVSSRRRATHEALDDARVSDSFTEHVLLLLGLDAEEAVRIVALELPEVPQIL